MKDMQSLESTVLGESTLGKTLDINNLNYSIPFLKSYTTTSPVLQELSSNNQSNNGWFYPTTPDVTQRTPLEAYLPEYSAPVGFWENFRHNAGKVNTLVQAGTFVADSIKNSFPADEYVPDDWTAMKPESVEGFPQQYYDYLTGAKGPNDLLMRQQNARKQMAEDEKFANGGIISSLLGGLAGTVTDPVSYLLPMAAGMKYTTLTGNVVRNLLKAQPAMAAGSIMTAGLEQANRIGGNLQDMAKNALVDYVYGDVLLGLTHGLGFYKDELTRMAGAKNLLKILPDGVKMNFEVKEAEDGGHVFTGGVKLTPMQGVAMSAQKLDAATLAANDVMAASGLFNTFAGKKLQDFLGWGFLASPVLRAANSPYFSVRSFFNRIAPISIRTAGEMLGNAVPFSASEIASFISDQGKKLNIFMNDKYAEANGIQGANTLKGATKLFKATWDENLTVTREQFAKDVILRVVKKDFVSEISQANEVGEALFEHFKQVGERFTKATGNDMFLDPRNAFRYLPMNYWIPAIRNNERSFIETIANEYKLQDEKIAELRRPLEGHEANIQAYKLEIENLKAQNKQDRRIKDFENRIALEERNLQIANDKLTKQLRDDKDLHLLLEDRVFFTSEEIEKLKEYTKPVKDAETKLNKQTDELKFAQDRLKETTKQIESIEKSKRVGAKSEKLADIKEQIKNIEDDLDKQIKELTAKKEPIKNRQEKTLADLKIKRSRIADDLKIAKQNNDEKAMNLAKNQLDKIRAKITSETESIQKLKESLKAEITDYRTRAEQAKKDIRKKTKTKKQIEADVQAKAQDLDFLKEEQKSLEREVEVQQGRVDKLQKEYEKVKYDLDDMARNGKIDKKYFKEYGNEIIFNEPKTPKFRKAFTDDNERELQAKALMESIYNESPSDILMNVFGSQEPGAIANPHYTKARTVMIDQAKLVNFIDPDLGKTVNNYSSVMGKLIGIREVMPEFAKGPTMEGVLLNFKIEHDARRAALEEEILSSNLTEKQAQIKRDKLDKEFTQAQKFMKDTLATYFGTYGGNKNPEIRKMITAFKNLVGSAKLGAVPLYIVQEFAGLLMKQGLMPFLSQGLGPAFRNIAKPVTDEEKLAYKEMSSHAFIGMNNCFMGYTNRFIEQNEMSYAPVNSASENFGRVTEKIAAVSNALYGSNMVQNLEEQLVANAGQSEVMSWCYKYLNGTITDVQRQKAARYGLDLANDAETFVKNYESTPGTWRKGEGYMSMYHKWEDAAAVNKMSMSLRRMVQDQVVQANKFTSPYWAQNEFLSTFFMFHGWAYGYLTKYAIPFMQRPDAEQALGLVMMTSLGMGIEATKRFINGKEMWDDDKKWYNETLKSLMDSGMLAGPYWQYAVELNNFLGVFPDVGTERFRDRRGIGQFSPIFGYAETGARVIHHLSKGDLTQGDLKSLLGLMPIVNSHLLLRRPLGDILKHTSLPEKRSEAEPWSFMASLYEE